MGWAATDRRSLQPRRCQSTAMPSRSFRSPMCWISLCSVALASAAAIQLPVVEQPHTARNHGAARGPRGSMCRGSFSVIIALWGLLSEEFLDMCDYSLHSVRTRPAKVGEKLVTHDFGTGTRGFAAPEDCSVAVCLLPGTELAFETPVKYQTASYFVPITSTPLRSFARSTRACSTSIMTRSSSPMARSCF